VLLLLGAYFILPKILATPPVPPSKTQRDLTVICNAIDHFSLECGRYPLQKEGLQALIERPKALANWQGPYLKEPIPADEWGNQYVYRIPGKNGKTGYSVTSYGADGAPGGTGPAADLISGNDY